MIAVFIARFCAERLGRAGLRIGLTVAVVLLLLLACRRSGERLGQLLERLKASEKSNDVQRKMLEAAARRPRNRDELAGRLREGRF